MQIDTGTTIEGILMGRAGGHYMLRTGVLKKDEDQSFSLDGEIRIPVGRVEFFQVLSG